MNVTTTAKSMWPRLDTADISDIIAEPNATDAK
jgi:hypothetical protein